jgi:hypothetical protein
MHGAETAEAKKTRAAILQVDTEHVKKEKALKQDQWEFDMKMGSSAAGLLKDGLQMVEDTLDKKSTAYRVFRAAQKTAALAELGINLAV